MKERGQKLKEKGRKRRKRGKRKKLRKRRKRRKNYYKMYNYRYKTKKTNFAGGFAPRHPLKTTFEGACPPILPKKFLQGALLPYTP